MKKTFSVLATTLIFHASGVTSTFVNQKIVNPDCKIIAEYLMTKEGHTEIFETSSMKLGVIYEDHNANNELDDWDAFTFTKLNEGNSPNTFLYGCDQYGKLILNNATPKEKEKAQKNLSCILRQLASDIKKKKMHQPPQNNDVRVMAYNNYNTQKR